MEVVGISNRIFPICIIQLSTALKKSLVDALAILASMLKILEGVKLCPINLETREEPIYYHFVKAELDGRPWFHDIRMFLKQGVYPFQLTHI